MAHRLLVVGGNGFLGSAVCKEAVGRGWHVTSISSSGKPYQTPKGHSPAWTSDVEWKTASAMDPTSYEEHLSKSSSVVHTIGTLFPDAGYKAALQSGNIPALLRILFSANNQNPLQGGSQGPSLYDTLNHDSALTVLATFLSNATSTASESDKDRTFVYISAEDVFRPFVPSQYIESKRKCEREIRRMCESADSPVRSIFIRPGLIYHPHLRPILSPAAALLSLSATLHDQPAHVLPTPADALRKLGSLSRSLNDTPPASHSLANLLETHPIHVEQVAQAICLAIERPDVEGPVNVKEMRRLIGWGTSDGVEQSAQPLGQS